MNREAPLVTVIVPAYNHERYVQECLQSVVAQDYPCLQIIVLDDGSSDNTKQVIQNYLKSSPRPVEFYSKSNEGLCKTLNYAISMAKGEFVAVIASDDIWLPDKISKEISFFNAHQDYGMVFCDAFFMRFDQKTDLRFSDYKTRIRKVFSAERSTSELFDLLMTENLVIAPTVMVRKSVYDEVGPYDSQLIYEDYDMWLRISQVYKIGYINEALAYYRTHETNLSNNTGLMIKGTLQTVFKQYRSPVLRHKPFKSLILFSHLCLMLLKNRITKYFKIKRQVAHV